MSGFTAAPDAAPELRRQMLDAEAAGKALPEGAAWAAGAAWVASDAAGSPAYAAMTARVQELVREKRELTRKNHALAGMFFALFASLKSGLQPDRQEELEEHLVVVRRLVVEEYGAPPSLGARQVNTAAGTE